MSQRFALLVLSLAVASLLALTTGEVALTPAELMRALTAPDGMQGPAQTILWSLRLPRLAMAILVGAALAVAGAVAQAIMRNPLAEPGILGINAGAALMAVLVIVQWQNVPASHLPWLSFLGAVAMSAAIWLLAWQDGTSTLRFILVGVGLSALAGSAATFVATFGDMVLMQRAMLWMAGSLQDSRWIKVEILALWLIVPLALIWLNARELDLIGFDESVARGLGQRVDLTRGMMVLAIAAISGAAVAAAGLIGFVGLVAPHMARRLVGHRHKVLLPGAALIGALMVVAADIVARSVIAPAQLPVGVTTAAIGAPFFGWLLWKKRNE
ncbi:FecCD family ABC transporter permease [Tropicimonas sp.]|uniref:FecCD family ABC transporter permease n=1 Tax=Tropicimonas sp. TaxID=2067044 RepID=UPI003A8567AE